MKGPMLLLAAIGMIVLPASADACNQCGCTPCCQQYKVVKSTAYVKVPTCKKVVTCKRVCCLDACGCPQTKVVREVSYVRGYKCVPVTTCKKVAVCCPAPAPTCCEVDPCNRPGLLDRIRARRSARACPDPCCAPATCCL